MKPRVSSTGQEADRILAVVRAARDVDGGIRHDLEITRGDEKIPAIFLRPHAHEPVPAVLLLHGFASRKERMADTLGTALMHRGLAALAVDLPLHGERSEAVSDLAAISPAILLSAWSAAALEARTALEFLGSHEGVDREELALVGYSLGSFLANLVASENETVRAVVLAAGGDLPDGLPYGSLVRSVIDPLRAVQRIRGRPLLMVNGRFDRTVTPAQAERLFAAAREPKTMQWYGGGHWPAAKDMEYAADWLASQLARATRRHA